MKRTVIFRDKNKKKFVIKIEIRDDRLSMSGEHGQEQNEIVPANIEQQLLVDTWNKYHLSTDLPICIRCFINEVCDNIKELEKKRYNSPKISESDFEELMSRGFSKEIIAIGLYEDLHVEDLPNIERSRFGYGNCALEIYDKEVYSGTEEEITEAVKDYIENTLYAFHPSFLSNYGSLSKLDDYEAALKPIQEQCESGNETVKALVDWDTNADEIVKDAIKADGIGHYLNSYDGTYETYDILGDTYYVCRA